MAGGPLPGPPTVPGTAVTDRPSLFSFVQLEFPWVLGPADGRYVLRAALSSAPEHIVVLATLGAPRRHLLRRRRRSSVPAGSDPAPVATARATVIDSARPLDDEQVAARWLGDLDEDDATRRAVDTVNRILFAHRIATADPHVHEVSRDRALVVRAGFGTGPEVADGRWIQARELRATGTPRERRTSALRPQERLALLLGGRDRALVCEELTLRARLDLEQDRLPHAALSLGDAYSSALSELAAERRADLGDRLTELRGLGEQVRRAAAAAGARTGAGTGTGTGTPRARGSTTPEPIDEASLRHALERLEAALRARSATGFQH